MYNNFTSNRPEKKIIGQRFKRADLIRLDELGYTRLSAKDRQTLFQRFWNNGSSIVQNFELYPHQ